MQADLRRVMSQELGSHLLQNNNFWYKELKFGVQEQIELKF